MVIGRASTKEHFEQIKAASGRSEAYSYLTGMHAIRWGGAALAEYVTGSLYQATLSQSEADRLYAIQASGAPIPVSEGLHYALPNAGSDILLALTFAFGTVAFFSFWIGGFRGLQSVGSKIIDSRKKK